MSTIIKYNTFRRSERTNKIVLPSTRKGEGILKNDRGKIVPYHIIQRYGCDHCEWKGSWQCPFRFKSGVGHPLKENRHLRGICVDREIWLKTFIDDTNPRPTDARFMDNMNRFLAQVQLNEDYMKMRQVEEEAKALERRSDERRLADAEAKEYRERWQTLWKVLQDSNSKQLDREQPKKVEMTIDNKMTISDINRILRGDRTIDGNHITPKDKVIDVEPDSDN
jgi:hypothetical protein